MKSQGEFKKPLMMATLMLATIILLTAPRPVLAAAPIPGTTVLSFSDNPATLSGDTDPDVTITTTTTSEAEPDVIDGGKVVIYLAIDGVGNPVRAEDAVDWMALNPPGQHPVSGITTLDVDLDALGFVCGTVAGFRAHYVPGDGPDKVGQHQSNEVDLTVECDCACEATETAFAFDATLGNCFLDMDLGFDRWGWSIGPLVAGDGITTGVYEFPIYAAAGQCDTSKGQLVGELLVSYSGGTVTVTYDMDSCRTLTETHLYAGNVPVPSDGMGGYTVAPGQYGNIHDGEEAPNAESDQYVISGLSGEIYIIAHAVVCVEPEPVE